MRIIDKLSNYLIQHKIFIGKVFRYIVVRGFGVILYAGIIVLLVEIVRLNAVLSSVISFVTLSLVLYFLSYKWVFNYEGKHIESFPKFITTEIITLLMNTSIMYVIIEVLSFDYYFGIIATTLIIPLTNLLLNFFWSFKEKD